MKSFCWFSFRRSKLSFAVSQTFVVVAVLLHIFAVLVSPAFPLWVSLWVLSCCWRIKNWFVMYNVFLLYLVSNFFFFYIYICTICNTLFSKDMPEEYVVLRLHSRKGDNRFCESVDLLNTKQKKTMRNSYAFFLTCCSKKRFPYDLHDQSFRIVSVFFHWLCVNEELFLVIAGGYHSFIINSYDLTFV